MFQVQLLVSRRPVLLGSFGCVKGSGGRHRGVALMERPPYAVWLIHCMLCKGRRCLCPNGEERRQPQAFSVPAPVDDETCGWV